jgi:hypothetical protein
MPPSKPISDELFLARERIAIKVADGVKLTAAESTIMKQWLAEQEEWKHSHAK